jgi:hypothetical protein
VDDFGVGGGGDYEDADDAFTSSHTSCLKGKAGSCIDVNTEQCDGATTVTNFCSGASNIKCCPEPGTPFDVGAGLDSGSNANDVETERLSDDQKSVADLLEATKISSVVPCAGMEGVCIDAEHWDCVGGVNRAGFCAGKQEIKCCPAPATPKAAYVFEEAQTPRWDGSGIQGCRQVSDEFNKGGVCYDPCVTRDGVEGTCYDGGMADCVGAGAGGLVQRTGVCNGGSLRTCCPLPGYIEEKSWEDVPQVDDDTLKMRFGTVRVFRQQFCTRGCHGSHACSLEASMRLTNGIPLMAFLSGTYRLLLLPP